MRIVLDTNVLVQVLRGSKPGSILLDPTTGLVVDRLEARAEALIEAIDAKSGLVLIPAPALAEYLIGVDRNHYQQHLDIISGTSCFQIVDFDQIAAIECARMVDDAELKQLDLTGTKAKLRFDRQIIAIALANEADEVWTHDAGLFTKAAYCGLNVKSLADIQPNPEQIEIEVIPPN